MFFSSLSRLKLFASPRASANQNAAREVKGFI
jgi:hypothetical protein